MNQLKQQLVDINLRLKKLKKQVSDYHEVLIPALIKNGYVGVGCNSQCYVVNLKVVNGVLNINKMPTQKWVRGVEVLVNQKLYNRKS